MVNRVRLSQVLYNQIPDFIEEDFPLFSEFLKEYYNSLESQGSTYDILTNIDKYIKLDVLADIQETTFLTQPVDFIDDTITVSSTYGFPNSYGLIKINNEIISYKSKNDTQFIDCIRGFVGVTSIEDELVFEDESVIDSHSSGRTVSNLSVIFLKEFFKKLKKQIAPGFEERVLDPKVNSRLFYKQVNDLYTSKGSDTSFEILFSALYGTKAEIIRPSDFLIEPSSANFRKTSDLVIYYDGTDDLTNILLNRTLYQNEEESDLISAYGAITNVEKIQRGLKEYYIVSIDSDYNKDTNVSGSIFGDFVATPSTLVVEDIVQNLNSTFPTDIYVDSTIGFENSRSLDVYLTNGSKTSVVYGGKTSNQFTNAFITNDIPKGSLISSKRYGYVYDDNEQKINFRITNVLSDLSPEKSSYFLEKDPIKFSSLGLPDKSVKSNNWIFNNTATYYIDFITKESGETTYTINLQGDFDLSNNDRFILSSEQNESYTVRLISRTSIFTYLIVSESGPIKNYNISTKNFKIQRKLNKANFLSFSESSTSLTDVSNVYRNANLDDKLFVFSSSLPSYSNERIGVNDKRVTFTLNVSKDRSDNTLLKVGPHSFYTGDAIIYRENASNRLNIQNGRYFVTVVDNTNIRLSNSLSNVFNDVYLEIYGNVTNNTLYYSDFFDIERILNTNNPFILKDRKLVKLISDPVNDIETHTTIPGKLGILKNGVEILNYKSKNSVFYGSIENISILSPGSNYDVINPPNLVISDTIGGTQYGVGATGNFIVSGSIQDVKVINGGFNYTETPIVTVSGGNGSGCNIVPVMETYTHTVQINSSNENNVGLSSNIIIADENHNFDSGEKVIYLTNKQTNIGGLVDKSIYYIGRQSNTTFSLHKTSLDSKSNINPIDLTSYGDNLHTFESIQKKKRIGKFEIIDSADDYTNRKVSYTSETAENPIDFYENTINIKNHGFLNKEIINYDSEGTVISGLTTGSYYITKVSNEKFKLSNVGSGSTEKDYFYENKEYVNLTDIGTGKQIFKYPDISITVSSSSKNLTSVPPEVSLSVKGEIKDVFLENNGSNYGSENILNYNRQPLIVANSGQNASVKPIIINGEIRGIIIENSGSGYTSVPDLVINTNGASNADGAQLVPVITNGILTDVIIKNKGFGYPKNTDIDLIPAGSGAKFFANIKKWTINEVARNFENNSSQIYDDDGFIHQDSSSELSFSRINGLLQYTHLYAPRKFRQLIYNRKVINGRTIFNPDLILDSSGKEIESKYHSPIIGWAYDGNPIYGPYGFSNINGSGGVKRIKSGYKIVSRDNRPNYPDGFFVEDYQHFDDGDLDIHNGRFCVTPEYPNGVYAYFSTIGENDPKKFKNYKLPVFPYFVGDSFKSKPIEFNYNKKINQDTFLSDRTRRESVDNISNYDLLRNITPYNVSNTYGEYENIFNPSDEIDIISYVNRVNAGKVTDIEIYDGGYGYKVGDKIIFGDDSTGNNRALARVSSIGGTEVSSIGSASSTITNVEISRFSTNSIIAISSIPHNLSNNTTVKIYNRKRNNNFVTDINVIPKELVLATGIGTTGTTGIVTYFNIYSSYSQNASLFNSINENDIYKIGNEQVKVLNFDRNSSRIRVEREFNGISGTSFSAGTKLYENPRIFTFPKNILTEDSFSSSKNLKSINKQLYFNPSESLGVGIGTTVTVENPGVGLTQYFIDSQRLYLPNHGIKRTNTKLYYDYDNSPIGVSNTLTNFNLQKDTPYYAYLFSNDYIGISERQVGVGSTGPVGLGSYTTLLNFEDFGVGSNHSFKTSYDDVLNVDVNYIEVTVTTSNSHGLINNNIITIDCKPSIEKEYNVIYNQKNNKFSINYITFNSIDVNVENNTITIENHDFITGQKVIHVSSAPCGGLTNDEIYYVIVLDKDTIKLSLDYRSYKPIENTTIVNITSASIGQILPINSPIKMVKNKTLVFDVSHPSLSFLRNNVRYSAFDLKFFYDNELKHEFITSKSSSSINIVKNGTFGVTSDAKIKLICDDNFPQKLYYNLVPLKDERLPLEYSNISLDENYENSISIVKSGYSGSYTIKNVTDTTFKYDLENLPENSSYTSSNSDIVYSSISTNPHGPINSIEFLNSSAKYKKIPEIKRIDSEIGSGAILFAKSNEIGKIKDINIENIGFEFPSDNTLRPRAYSPIILKINSSSSIEKIEVENPGKNYSILPDLVVLDGISKKTINDIVLDYVYNDGYKVEILKNTKGISNSEPTIIPIKNTNGYKIKNITYDSSSKNAEVTLDVVGFSTLSSWPFPVGTKVLVEGVITQDLDNDLGYNSSEYEYKLFTVNSDDPNIGGQNPSFTFNMEDFVGFQHPGFFDVLFKTGRVIPSTYFPVFNTTFTKNKFFKDELIKNTNNNAEDRVISWDSNSNILKLFTGNPEFYSLGNILEGKISNNKGVINEIVGISTLIYQIDATNKKRSRFLDKKGFLNDEYQRIHDSDYYQYFSYSIKSNVGINSWGEPVESILHPVGVKKFSDLQVISGLTSTRFNTEQNESGFLGISNIDSVINLNCYSDIDLATENNIKNLYSDEIRFNTLDLADYFQSIGNRVLIVDDISSEFNSNPRTTKYSTLESWSLEEYRAKRYLLLAVDKKYDLERQAVILSGLHDGSNIYTSEYGKISTIENLGDFEIGITDNYAYLLFYPIDYEFSDFNLSGFSYGFGDISGISTQYIGDVAKVSSSSEIISSGLSTSAAVVGIDSTYTSSKVFVVFEAVDNSYYEYNEFNIVLNDDIYFTEYSSIVSGTLDNEVGSGIGSYNMFYSGDEVVVEIEPYSSLTTSYTVKSTVVSISNTSRTSTGSTVFNTTLTKTGYALSTTDSVTNPIEILNVDSSYYGLNAFVSIEDLTNGINQMSELVIVHDDNTGYISEFGLIDTDSSLGLGTFSSSVDSSTNKLILSFEPLPNREVEIRVFANSVSKLSGVSSLTSFDYEFGDFKTINGDYFGTENEIKKDFDLKHKGRLIFERSFDSEDVNIVSTDDDLLNIENHYFVSGELLTYSYPESGSPIGIAETTIPGIGLTDKLPSSLYAVKVTDGKLQFASTAENALKFNPITLSIDSIGVGTNHKLTSTNKNAKGLFTIDNMIQSPINETDITTELQDHVTLTDSVINTVGVTSIFSGDILKINDEIFFVKEIGIGTQEKLGVRRGWVGTTIGIHSSGDTVTKLEGNYNIVNSKIHFTEAPYGKVPTSNSIVGYGLSRINVDEVDFVGIETNSSFHGRTFMRSGIPGGSEETYTKNYVFDNIQTQFTGIKSDFVLKVDGSDVTGISTDNAIVLVKNIFQQPQRSGINSVIGNYSLTESSGQTTIEFIPSTQTPIDDINVTNLPVGGVIVSVGSTQGFGYQPLVSAGGTATISGFGTISNISIGNSGSGYRPGIQTNINVYAETSSSISKVGYASALNGHIYDVIITNPGTSYTNINPPNIKFDAPLSYSNIPLLYSEESSSGVGTGAEANLIVSNDSSVLSFEMDNNGYAYKPGELLTVSIGGETGIPTDTSKTYDEFQVIVDRVHYDSFNSWTLGSLQQLDPIDDRFDGRTRSFPISFKGDSISIKAKLGSNIDVESLLMVFINDILQVPGQSYTLKGGGILVFSEPPKEDYTSRIIFYRGTEGVDVNLVDVISPIEIGDKLQLKSDELYETEEQRTVEEILSSSIVETNPYSGPGRLNDDLKERPVTLCQQTEDLFIGDRNIGKNRVFYEAKIFPQTNLIQNVGVGSSFAFVESVSTFFNNGNENIDSTKLGKIQIISKDTTLTAIATAVVSSSGTVSSINVTNVGSGYTDIPEVSISPGIGTTIRALATASISSGSVTSISVSDGGVSYSSTSPPSVLIESPKVVIEEIEKVSYEGDFGSIVSISNTTVGVAETALLLGLYIDSDSYLFNQGVNPNGLVSNVYSGIQTNYFFVASNTNVGNGMTSRYNNGNRLSISTDNFDNVFQVYDINQTTGIVTGIGTTSILEIYTLVDYPVTSVSGTTYYGDFSWGKISWSVDESRKNPKDFSSYYAVGYSGIETSAFVRRRHELEFKSYTSFE